MKPAAFIVVSYLFHFAEWQSKHCLMYTPVIPPAPRLWAPHLPAVLAC